MTLYVNGERVDVAPDERLGALVERLGFHVTAVAVAVGSEVVPRAKLAERALVDGDRVEIIRAVGGG